MATGFKVSQIGNYAVDVDDILIRREYFNDGTLWGCGYNSKYQLGLGNGGVNATYSMSSTAGGGTNWKQVAAGAYHTSGIKTDGTLWTWGWNNNGVLGENYGIPSTGSRSSPGTTAGGGTNWKQVSCSYSHNAAVKTDGTLWTWGNGASGQLGNGSSGAGNVIASPVTVAGGETNWKKTHAGSSATFSIKTDNTLWGTGYYPGNGSSLVSSFVQIAGGGSWSQVSGSGEGNCAAIKTDGTLWTWGKNGYGELGDGTFSSRLSPITTLGGGTNWKQVAVSYLRGMAAIKTDGTLWTWGSNLNGQLGDGTTVSSILSPATVAGGGTNWKQVSNGYQHTAAIKTDGTLWTWGYNQYYELGISTGGITRSPVTTITGGTNWKQVACGYLHTQAITDLTI
jgi:alpha-tubulin suppressor-like RCC1 family protein